MFWQQFVEYWVMCLQSPNFASLGEYNDGAWFWSKYSRQCNELWGIIVVVVKQQWEQIACRDNKRMRVCSSSGWWQEKKKYPDDLWYKSENCNFHALNPIQIYKVLLAPCSTAQTRYGQEERLGIICILHTHFFLKIHFLCDNPKPYEPSHRHSAAAQHRIAK